MFDDFVERLSVIPWSLCLFWRTWDIFLWAQNTPKLLATSRCSFARNLTTKTCGSTAKKKIRVSGYHVPLKKGTILRGEESSLLQDMSVFRGVGSFWGSNYFWTKHLESTRSMSIFTEFDLESTCNDRRGLADFTHEWKNYRKSQRKTSNTIGTSSSFWEVSLPTQLPNTNIVLTTPSLWTTQKKH